MPCYDDRNSPNGGQIDDLIEQRNRAQNQVRKLEAMLCSVIRAAPAMIFDVIDYKEAGVTRKELEGWWNEHRRKDEERKAREIVRKKTTQQSHLLKMRDKRKARRQKI